MNEFQKNDKFWSIDLYIECGTVIDFDKKVLIMPDPNYDRKRRATAKTKNECINDMIGQLENLRDFPSDY